MGALSVRVLSRKDIPVRHKTLISSHLIIHQADHQSKS